MEEKDVNEEEYSGKLILKYRDRSDEKRIRTIVGRDYIKTEIIGVTGYAIRQLEEPSPMKISPLWILVILLVIVNIGWFVFYFMTRRKNEY